MSIANLLSRDCVAIDLKVTSKKQLIQEMAQLILASETLKDSDLELRQIVSAAMERERLGSTGVGSGVALPHARLDGLDKVHIAIARLETAVEFEAIDDRPVDLVVLILAPSDAGGEHLRALAQVSRRLRKDELRARLRSAPNAESVYIAFTDDTRANAA